MIQRDKIFRTCYEGGRVFENRIWQQVKIDDMQFGYMPDKGTTDAIFVVSQLHKKLIMYCFCPSVGARNGNLSSALVAVWFNSKVPIPIDKLLSTELS